MSRQADALISLSGMGTFSLCRLFSTNPIWTLFNVQIMSNNVKGDFKMLKFFEYLSYFGAGFALVFMTLLWGM